MIEEKAALEASIYLPRYLPRKGTETNTKEYKDLEDKLNICHDIYPARGRKLFTPLTHCIAILSNLPRYLPRKGTETEVNNNTIIDAFTNLPRYLPRKGTETLSSGKTNEVLSCYLPRYLPRKGTETSENLSLASELQELICHDIYPARGRKRMINSNR